MILLAALVVSIVFAAGTYLLLQRDLTRVVVGIILISNSAVLFIIASGLMRGGPPIYPLGSSGPSPTSDPLVQAMALTALVIGFAVAALLLAMIYRLYAAYGNVDVEEIAAAEMREAEALDQVDRSPEIEEIPAEEQDAASNDRAETMKPSRKE